MDQFDAYHRKQSRAQFWACAERMIIRLSWAMLGAGVAAAVIHMGIFELELCNGI